MPPVSRIRRDTLDPLENLYMMAAPRGDSRRRFLWPALCGRRRRDVIAAWQAIYPEYTWRKAYRRGWRVVRVRVTLAERSAVPTIEEAE